MIEQDYVDVESKSETEDDMDCTRSNSTRSKVTTGEASPSRTTKQSNDIVTNPMQMLTRSDAALSKSFEEAIDLLEEMNKSYTHCRCPGPSFKDLRGGIVHLDDLAKDAGNDSRANLRLLSERLQSAQTMRNETMTSLALKDDVRILRDDLAKLTKNVTTDNNSVPPALKKDFKILREAVEEGLWLNHQSSQDLKKRISAVKGQCSEDDDKNGATLHLLVDELDTFRYELAMLRRDITIVRVPGAREDVSISKDVNALYMSVNTLERKFGKKTVGCHDIISPILTDIPTLRNQIRILRGAASSIHDLLLRNEKNMHQRAPELNSNLVLKSHIRATQVLLKILRDRINYGPSPALHHALLEHDAAMAEKEDAELRKEIAWLRNEKNPENDTYTSWLLGPFTDQDSLKEKILDLCKKDAAFKDKLTTCVPTETQALPAAMHDEVESAKKKGNISSADSEASWPEQKVADTNESKPEQNTADGETLEPEQSALEPDLLEFDRTFSGY